ncbi:ABC transporter ATP-binding protein [Agaribacter flavus]|uniref:ATP-binding cassette domain-containing protein n=1 Tax=Agaribacter flavus TaxID=1902781 RepID=A0ABV7FLB7_9ALTE
MIKISKLAKKFKIENPKKLSEQDKKDPRLQGRFFHSVKNVQLYCEQGEVLGLLGPNGAGKTTTLRVLSTALQADEGSIFIGDTDVINNPVEARKKIGFLSGSTGLYGRLTGRENIAYFGRLNGMSDADISAKVEQLADQLDMHTFLDRRSENYSTGMKQKTSIARAVVHNPKVVVLDEPTTGLDIMAANTVIEFIKSLKAAGVPVIFSTHHLDEVSELCDKVAVIDYGETSFEGSVDEFKQQSNEGLHAAFMACLNRGEKQ